MSFHRALRGSSLSIFSALFLALAPQMASPADKCSGAMIEHISIYNRSDDWPGRPLLGYLDVYYDAGTGYNCARTVTGGRYWGKAAEIGVWLTRCKEISPGPTCIEGLTREQGGQYHYYAGPVRVHAPHNCIYAMGYIGIGRNTDLGHIIFGHRSTSTSGNYWDPDASHC